MSIAMIKKLSTPKILGGKPRLKDGEERRDLYNVMGIASNTKTGETDHGPWCALTGNFAAINLETGEQFRSAVVFLPDIALDMVRGQLDTGANAVEFGFMISIVADEGSATGYVYTATPLMEPDENDPLEVLTNQFANPDNLLTHKKVEEVEHPVVNPKTRTAKTAPKK